MFVRFCQTYPFVPHLCVKLIPLRCQTKQSNDGIILGERYRHWLESSLANTISSVNDFIQGKMVSYFISLSTPLIISISVVAYQLKKVQICTKSLRPCFVFFVSKI